MSSFVSNDVSKNPSQKKINPPELYEDLIKSFLNLLSKLKLNTFSNIKTGSGQ